MKKFNINRKTKRDLAKKVLVKIGNNDYTELSIVYIESNIFPSYFDTTGTNEIDLINSTNRGEVFYKSFTNYKIDGKITLAKIENQIFN